MKKLLRWTIFLPTGMLCALLLQAIPLTAWEFELKFTPPAVVESLLILIIGLVIIPLICLWVAGVYYTPHLACRKIAPVPTVATVIFGTVYVLAEIISIVMLVTAGRVLLMVYHLIFSAILIAGMVATYRDARPAQDHGAFTLP